MQLLNSICKQFHLATGGNDKKHVIETKCDIYYDNLLECYIR